MSLLTSAPTIFKERERLQRFSQAHFIGKNAAEAVRTQKMQPRDTLFLIRPQYRFQISERWTFQLCFAALPRRAVAPR